jgi:phospholipase/carboxylesterase
MSRGFGLFRRLSLLILLVLGQPALAAQTDGAPQSMRTRQDRSVMGKVSARPSPKPSAPAFTPGLHWLDVGARKPALFVPNGLDPNQRMPLVVLLHGAGGAAGDILPLMQGAAEADKFLVLAPQSQGRTWDVILGTYGPDIEALDRALDIVFHAQAVDPERIAVAGFSDGASYALSLGLANGNLFGDVLAFSPGFMAPAAISGKPRIFISHGTDDTVLPIDRCSRRIVPQLRREGYDVEYREFHGPHVVPPEMVIAALQRFRAPR